MSISRKTGQLHLGYYIADSVVDIAAHAGKKIFLNEKERTTPVEIELKHLLLQALKRGNHPTGHTPLYHSSKHYAIPVA
jgi:hypothetical protein